MPSAVKHPPKQLFNESPVPAASRFAFVAGRAPRNLLYLLLVLGVFLRLFHYLNNRSFFIDETLLNVNLIKMSYWELATQPLEYEQKAPLGYLWTVRLLVSIFGKQELALRLFSVLCGVASLLLFVPVARFFLNSWGTVLAVGILALAHPAVYHAVEAKQYGTELLATIAALALYINYRKQTSLRARLAWGVWGGLLLWFSFPAIFVLAGIGVAGGLAALGRRDWPRLLGYAIPGALWLLSFGLQYVFFISKYQDSGWLHNFFAVRHDAYLPLAQPLAAAKWLAVKVYEFFSHPLGLLVNNDPRSTNRLSGFSLLSKLVWLYVLLSAVGVLAYLRQSKQRLLVLAGPVALTLLASALNQYPFYQRLTLFLAPLGIVVVAHGAEQLISRLRGSRELIYLVFLLVLTPSFINSAQQVANPASFYNRSYYRDFLLYINENYQPGDVVYCYWNVYQGYNYYQPAYDLKYPAIRGSIQKLNANNQAEYLAKLQPELAAIQGKKRLWFVYDNNWRDPIGHYVDQPAWYFDKKYPPGRVLSEHFATLGRKVSHYQIANYCVELYELNP